MDISSFKQVPLTPAKGGGLCIATEALRPGDLILSTTRAASSGMIRIATGFASVSHVRIYAGGGQVIEAIPRGVVVQPLETSMLEDALAVAYRDPKVDAATGALIVAAARSRIGKPYGYVGAALSATKAGVLVGSLESIGVGAGPDGSADSYFCSKLAAEAYWMAGRSLSNLSPAAMTPADIARAANDLLVYIGHLKGSPSWIPWLAP
jgi:hypothetical protein